MTAEDAATQQGRLVQLPATPEATLQHLFNSVDDPIDNPSETCARVIPYVRQALEQTPSSRQLRETLAFLQGGVMEATHTAAAAAAADASAETEAAAQAPPWTCSNGELHAIIHMLNDEQLLIEDRGTMTNTDTTSATTVHDVDGLDGLEGALAATVLLSAPVAPVAAAAARRLADATSTASTDAECERDTAFLDELRTGAASCEEEEAQETYPGQHEEADNAFLRELAGSVEEWE